MAKIIKTTTRKKEEIKNRDLVGWIFSWSIPDIINKTLYKDKVFLSSTVIF